MTFDDFMRIYREVTPLAMFLFIIITGALEVWVWGSLYHRALKDVEKWQKLYLATRAAYASAPSPARFTPEFVARLRRVVAQGFDQAELKDIAFDLDVEYDDLPGETHRDKVRELTAYLDRHGRVADLVAYLRVHRPELADGLDAKGVKE